MSEAAPARDPNTHAPSKDQPSQEAKQEEEIEEDVLETSIDYYYRLYILTTHISALIVIKIRLRY